MPKCPQCGSEIARVRRSRWQRLAFESVFRCNRCHVVITWYYPFLHRQLVHGKFIFSLYSRCLRCASYAVTSHKKRDYIDPFSKHLLGRFQGLLWAPTKRCPACRLQYYDWRPVRRARETPS